MENFVQSRYTVVSLVDGTPGILDGSLFVVSIACFLAWAALPVATGYWRFARGDLT